MKPMSPLTDSEFSLFQRFIYEQAGITLSSAKKTLVSGRLTKRLQHLSLENFRDYFALLAGGSHPQEVQTAVDLLTTNETYFFREAAHFDKLRELASVARQSPGPFRVWSAACSSGEEAYSTAMVLDDTLGEASWEILGTDISTRVLQAARAAHYPMERARQIPPSYLKRYCLKGIEEQQGTLLVASALRRRVQFRQANLNMPLPQLGMFDAIFLRNVMIYFNDDTKRKVVERVVAQLKPGGHFFIGHSESLNEISDAVVSIGASTYLKR